MRKKTLLLTLIVLFLPTATAFSINNFDILYNGESIEYIGQDRTYEVIAQVDLEFEEDNVPDQISLNLSSFMPSEPDSLSEVRVNIDNCRILNDRRTRYRCEVGLGQPVRVSLRSEEEQSDSFQVQASPVGASGTQTASKTVTIDNETPEVVFVGPERCRNLDEDEDCYISPRLNTNITIDIDKGAFTSAEAVAIILGDDREIIADECEVQSQGGTPQTRCTATIDRCLFIQSRAEFSCGHISNPPFIGCQDIQGMTISESATDTAGFSPEQGQPLPVRCDSNPPEIHSVDIPNEALFQSGETLDGALNISDTREGTVDIKTSGRGIINRTTQCDVDENGTLCGIDIELYDVEEGTEARLNIDVVDSVGNKAQGEFSSHTIRITSDINVNFWENGQVRSNIDPVLTRTLSAAPNFRFGTVEFSRTRGADRVEDPEERASLSLEGDVELAGAVAGTQPVENSHRCSLSVPEDARFNEDNLPFQVILKIDNVNTSGRAHFTTKIEGGSMEEVSQFDELEATCSVVLNSLDDNAFFEQPEVENFTFTIPLDHDNDITERFADNVEAAQDRIERHDELMNKVGTWIQTGTNICRARQAISQAGIGVNIAGEAAAGTIVGDAVAPSLATTEILLGVSLDGVDRFIDPVCEVLTCASDPYEVAGLPDQYNPIKQYQNLAMQAYNSVPLTGNSTGQNSDGSLFSNAISAMGGGRSGVDGLDAFTSEYVAYASLCLPAIIHHQQQKRLIDCEYVQCMQHATAQGLPPSFCQQQKEYDKCVYTATNVVGAIPGFSFISQNAQVFAQVLRDPVGLGFAIRGGVCPPGSAPGSFFCRLTSNWYDKADELTRQTNNIQRAVQTKNMLQDAFRTEAPDVCSGMQSAEFDTEEYTGAGELQSIGAGASPENQLAALNEHRRIQSLDSVQELTQIRRNAESYAEVAKVQRRSNIQTDSLTSSTGTTVSLNRQADVESRLRYASMPFESNVRDALRVDLETEQARQRASEEAFLNTEREREEIERRAEEAGVDIEQARAGKASISSEQVNALYDLHKRGALTDLDIQADNIEQFKESLGIEAAEGRTHQNVQDQDIEESEESGDDAEEPEGDTEESEDEDVADCGEQDTCDIDEAVLDEVSKAAEERKEQAESNAQKVMNQFGEFNRVGQGVLVGQQAMALADNIPGYGDFKRDWQETGVGGFLDSTAGIVEAGLVEPQRALCSARQPQIEESLADGAPQAGAMSQNEEGEKQVGLAISARSYSETGSDGDSIVNVYEVTSYVETQQSIGYEVFLLNSSNSDINYEKGTGFRQDTRGESLYTLLFNHQQIEGLSDRMLLFSETVRDSINRLETQEARTTIQSEKEYDRVCLVIDTDLTDEFQDFAGSLEQNGQLLCQDIAER